MKKPQLAIIGSAGPEEYPQNNQPQEKIFRLAKETGKTVAQAGAILITGGRGGVMEAASKGAKEANGITAGVISGNQRSQSNQYVDVEIVSGINNCGEESLLVSMSDGLIIIGGGSGTLQEIANAYRNKKPMVAFTNVPGWGKKLAGRYLDERKKIKIIGVKTPKEAIRVLLQKIKVLL